MIAAPVTAGSCQSQSIAEHEQPRGERGEQRAASRHRQEERAQRDQAEHAKLGERLELERVRVRRKVTAGGVAPPRARTAARDADDARLRAVPRARDACGRDRRPSRACSRRACPAPATGSAGTRAARASTAASASTIAAPSCDATRREQDQPRRCTRRSRCARASTRARRRRPLRPATSVARSRTGSRRARTATRDRSHSRSAMPSATIPARAPARRTPSRAR